MNKKVTVAITERMKQIARLKKEVAFIITSDWELSEAKTISEKDIKSLQKSAPEFGVLQEKGGKKIYAFLGGSLIKKKVIPSGSLSNEKEMLLQIEKAFTFNDLSRTIG
jgi:hypothetical protein